MRHYNLALLRKYYIMHNSAGRGLWTRHSKIDKEEERLINTLIYCIIFQH